jgi:formate acetyltransferase 1
MALHDHPVHRFMVCGIAGLSVAADSLSAVKYARVKVFRDASGLAVDFRTEDDFPAFGNDDDRADGIAVELVESCMARMREHPTHREAEHTQSVLTITSNVVYGKHTGNTPDGRRAGVPFAPGATAMNGRDLHGMAASALSVAKLPYEQARDGISLTSTVTPEGLGHDPAERAGNLAGILGAHMGAGGFHMKGQRVEPGGAGGRDGTPGEVPGADGPGVRASTAPVPGSCSSSAAAGCAACTARIPTPGTCATARRRPSPRARPASTTAGPSSPGRAGE